VERAMTRRRKIGLYLFGILVVGLAIIFVLLQSNWFLEHLKNYAIHKLEDGTKATVQIDAIAGEPLFGRLALLGVKIVSDSSAPPLFELDEMRIEYRIFELIGSERRIRSLEFVRPHLHVERGEDSRDTRVSLPVSSALDTTTTSGTGGWVIDRISITDGAMALPGREPVDSVEALDALIGFEHRPSCTALSLYRASLEIPHRLRLRQASGVASLENGMLSLNRLILQTENSFLTLSGSCDLGLSSLTSEIEAAPLSLRDVGMITGLDLAGDLHSNLHIERDSAEISGNAYFELTEGRVGQIHLDDVRGSTHMARGDLTFQITQTAAGAGSVYACGSLQLDEPSLPFSAEVELNDVDLVGLHPTTPRRFSSRLTGSVTAQGEGLGTPELFCKGDLDLGRSRIGELIVDQLSGSLSLSGESMEIHALRASVDSSVLQIDGSLEPREVHLSIVVDMMDASPIASLAGWPAMTGMLNMDMDVEGSPESPSVMGTLYLYNGTLPGMRFAYLGGNVHVSSIITNPLGEATIQLADGAIAGHEVSEAILSLTSVERGQIVYGLDMYGEEMRWQMEGEAAFETEGRVQVLTRKLLFGVKEDSLYTTEPVLLTVDRDSLILEPFVVLASEGQIVLGGQWGPQGRVHFQAEAAAIDLQHIAQTFHITTPLKGTTDFALRYQGTLGKPTIQLDLKARDIIFGEADAEEMYAKLEYHDHMVYVDEISLVRESERSTLAGTVPVDLSWGAIEDRTSQGNINLDAHLSNVGIWIFWPLKPVVDVRKGLIAGDIMVRGTMGEPVITGMMEIRDAEFFIRSVGAWVHGVSATIEADGSRILIRRITGRTQDGQLEVSGEVGFEGLSPKTVDLKVKTSGTPVTGIEYIQATVGSDLTIRGPLDAPRFEGTVNVEKGLVTMPFRRRQATAAMLRSPIEYDIQIEGPRHIWLRNADADIELGGTVRLRREAGKTFVTGSMETHGGTYYYLDRSFEIIRGQFDFTNAPELNPNLDILAQTELMGSRTSTMRDSNIVVTLVVTGTMQKPEFTLHTDQGLTQHEILLLLTLDMTWDELASGGLFEGTPERVWSYMEKRLSRHIQRSVGLDAFQLETDIFGEEREARLTLGKYVSDDLFASYTHDLFAASKDQFKLEYFFHPHRSLVAQRDEEGIYDMGIQLRFRY
jgi:autotransporter translocation and assembly factor TamB